MATTVFSKPLSDQITNLIKVKVVGLGSTSYAANSVSEVEFAPVDLPETGYTPIGVVGYKTNGSGHNNILCRQLCINNNNVIRATVWNATGSACTVSVNVYVLYIKNFT